jgi:hypothetical protein
MNSKAAPLSREARMGSAARRQMDPVGQRGDRIVHRHRLGVVEIGADLGEEPFHRRGKRRHVTFEGGRRG